jgi:hypothetical protein
VSKYMLLFVGKEGDPDDQSEQTREYSAKWAGWMGELAGKGALESGLPFEWSGKVVKSDSVEDLELDEVDIGGYLLVNAGSIDEAVEIAGGAPNVELGGSVIVRECAEIPGQ